MKSINLSCLLDNINTHWNNKPFYTKTNFLTKIIMECDNFIIKKSAICNGFGLFSLKDFSKGDKLYTKCYYQIPKQALDIIFVNNPQFKNLKMMERLWGHNNSFYTSLNVDQYINHSPNPNCCHGIALKTITAGEEIFEDYSSFDNEPWFHSLNTSMGVWSFK